ncbi:histidine phosphatase family protein [Jiella marina]|uniref:histidine phosphatase family protein n=1 Tax=Jiella sp. LLJ827 TaxID=2917712 RepID=UPI0021018BF0|nr:histidine phosphatase family protein [Jiella sp. LLJ827]MCQ0986581.1 histidine phosphatase family protein [Jiella sp. LLJ827]
MIEANLGEMPELFVCRHGQTEWNAEGRLQGQVEIPLNALGQSQARRNGRYLRNVLRNRLGEFRFLASPLGRAMNTMRILRGEMSLDPDDFETDDRLVELDFGDWQGHTMDQIAEFDAEGLAKRKKDKWGFVPPGEKAESYAMLAERAKPVFESITEPTVLVAHGGVTRSFLALYGNVPGQEAARIDIPHDRLLHAHGNKIEWV